MRKLIFVITVIMQLSFTMLNAQTYKMEYSYTTDPFKWKINKIECEENNSTYIYLTVKNTAYDTRTLNFSKGEYVVAKLKLYPREFKATSNSVVNSKNFNLHLKPGQEVPILLKFPLDFYFLYAMNFDLNIATHFTLKDIKLPELTLANLNENMQTWDEYYFSHRKVVPTNTIDDIKKEIKNEVENWQKKGEFESTAAWKTRVNDNSRDEFIKTTTNDYLKKYEKQQQQIQQEQTSLARDYERYKEDLLNKFYQLKIGRAKNEFTLIDFDLMPYDADHETFLIHSIEYGDILLPVPISDAPSFKQNWDTIKYRIMPEFVPNGDDVALTKLVFTNNSKEYVYDSHTKAKYTIIDVKYNFAPIEIADVNITNFQIDEISAIPDEVSSTMVGKTSSNVLTIQDASVETVNITARKKSNVDTDIPQNITNNNTSTFAVIIANENYHSVSDVPYASNDGEILGKYLTHTVGLPQDHVKVYKNASFGNMAAALRHIENLSEAFGNDLNLIFYYAGHGMPNEKTKNPMLIPVDGDATITETCYEFDKIITNLGGLNANLVIVILDACFSGTERGDGMLVAARGLRIKSNQSEPVGNMVVLSASQGDETAYPFNTERHGLFTYILLKKLQENKGDVTLGELSDYITEQVKRLSVVSLGKLQTPTVSVSASMKDIWRNLKLR